MAASDCDLPDLSAMVSRLRGYVAQGEEEWNRNIRNNLSGMFLCMKYEIPLMLKQGGGAIVNKLPGTASVCSVAPNTQQARSKTL
jgi:NAD(P)-dependent dehydrogenase (short-subunit alcohol dehydrogenase family)